MFNFILLLVKLELALRATLKPNFSLICGEEKGPYFIFKAACMDHL